MLSRSSLLRPEKQSWPSAEGRSELGQSEASSGVLKPATGPATPDMVAMLMAILQGDELIEPIPAGRPLEGHRVSSPMERDI